MKGIYSLVGMKHWSAESIVKALPNGEPLLLVREPSNPADPHAIQVWARGAAVGYIGRGRAPGEKYKPGVENVALAKYIDDNGEPLNERVPGFYIAAKLVATQPPQIEVDEQSINIGTKWP